VALSGDTDSVEVVDRRRIVTVGSGIPGASQPYHYAAKLTLPEAERHLATCAAVSEQLALAEIEAVIRELDGRHYRIAGSAILLASGRPLPSLAKLLASHPMIHTAEGEFFRNAASKACEGLGISVLAIRERELAHQAKEAFGNAATRVQRQISNVGRSIGPPWTKDQKNAALAASLILARRASL